MIFKHIATALFLFCIYTLTMAQTVNIIPQPQNLEITNGSFEFNDKSAIYYYQPKLKFLAEYTASAIKSLNRLEIPIQENDNYRGMNPSVRLILDSTLNLGKEAYTLSVNSLEINIKASTEQGLFYGIQTLIQLIPANGDLKIPSVEIQDAPRFGWRGLMLDVSRHFFTIDEVKRMIDQMVMYKFNLLHLHLSDDQGWRLEIKKLPELTRIGAWRVPRTGLWKDREPPQKGEEATEGGLYTQYQMKELIEYASKRFVQILPEIDVPGHSLAAIASYPYLSSTKLNYSVNPGSKFYKIDDNSLCPGKESTFEFLDKVFTEIADLFPFEYIHIGGDECYKGFWEKCPDCQKLMKKNGLKDENELQSYFVKRLEKMLNDKGKKLIGWDEILEGGLAPNATVMSWRGMDGGITAAKANHHVVMSPSTFAYLDLYQGDPAIEPPTYSMLRFKTVYTFEPVPEDVDPSYILGGQGNLWTESVPTFRHAEYMLWPRSFALAEVLWSPKTSRNWTDFVHRTEAHLQRFSIADINYSRSFYDAILKTTKDEQNNLQITLSTEIEGLNIYYTFDNTYPDHHSPIYHDGEKLSIPKDADTFKVITYKNGKPIGRMIVVSIADLTKRKK